MNIKIKKHLLLYKGYKLKCSIGKSGITSFKKERDFATPKGTFKLGLLYYRKDRIRPPKCKIRTKVIKNKGSAIFLHLKNNKNKATAGCIAITKKDFLKIIPLIGVKTKISIN